jgi:hypothetical protein
VQHATLFAHFVQVVSFPRDVRSRLKTLAAARAARRVAAAMAFANTRYHGLYDSA